MVYCQKKLELRNCLRNEKPDIMGITETKLTKDKEIIQIDECNYRIGYIGKKD